MSDILSVVIPAYNEEHRIRPTIERLHGYLRSNFRDFEIIVVDDGSVDNTASIVKALKNQLGSVNLVQYHVNAGKGYAVKKGVMASKGNLALMCDADLSTPIEEIEKLLPFLQSGFDIAIGSRGLRESEIMERQPWYRENMGKIFNYLVRMLAVRAIHDTQCGFKLFKGETARRLFAKSMISGFSFDVEILFLARKYGYRMKEVPVRWINSPSSKVRLVSDPAKMFLDLLKLRLNWALGAYDEKG